MGQQSITVISLNTWCGEKLEPLLGFLARHAATTDVFCFQEVSAGARGCQFGNGRAKGIPDLLIQIHETIPSFGLHFNASWAYTDPDGLPIPYGMAIFVRDRQQVQAHRHFFIHGAYHTPLEGSQPRLAQELTWGDPPVRIANVHGLHTPSCKSDTPARLAQAWALRRGLKDARTPLILCGDFNLLPKTRSLAIIRGNMRNLVAEHGITTTRSAHFPDRDVHPYADYIFTRDLEIDTFEVLPDVVSDHLALRVVARVPV